MTHREQQALPALITLITGVLIGIGLVLLYAAVQEQDEQDARVVSQVIACSQVAEMCRAAK